MLSPLPGIAFADDGVALTDGDDVGALHAASSMHNGNNDACRGLFMPCGLRSRTARPDCLDPPCKRTLHPSTRLEYKLAKHDTHVPARTGTNQGQRHVTLGHHLRLAGLGRARMRFGRRVSTQHVTDCVDA